MSRSLDIPIDFDGEAVRHPELADGYAWEWLANVPARYSEAYALLVTSLYDSLGSDPNLQYFMVTAHTDSPLDFYDSEIAEGYSVDNLAPAAPAALAGAQQLRLRRANRIRTLHGSLAIEGNASWLLMANSGGVR